MILLYNYNNDTQSKVEDINQYFINMNFDKPKYGIDIYKTKYLNQIIDTIKDNSINCKLFDGKATVTYGGRNLNTILKFNNNKDSGIDIGIVTIPIPTNFRLVAVKSSVSLVKYFYTKDKLCFITELAKELFTVVECAFMNDEKLIIHNVLINYKDTEQPICHYYDNSNKGYDEYIDLYKHHRIFANVKPIDIPSKYVLIFNKNTYSKLLEKKYGTSLVFKRITESNQQTILQNLQSMRCSAITILDDFINYEDIDKFLENHSNKFKTILKLVCSNGEVELVRIK